MPFTANEIVEVIRFSLQEFAQQARTEDALLKDRLQFGHSIHQLDADGRKVRIDPRTYYRDDKIATKPGSAA